MNVISIFDTTVSDYNMGNQIIMDAVNENLYRMFEKDFFYHLPYKEFTDHTNSCLKKSILAFFGGTNSLCPQIEKYCQWGIDKSNYKKINNLVLMGLGWWQYSDKTSKLSKKVLKRVLESEYMHSVRDLYTKNKLEEIGIKNVINTGCPTIWSLTKDHCKRIPKTKSKNVIFSFTDYKKDVIRDGKILDILKENYERLFFWPQGVGDYNYFIKEFGQSAEIITPRLNEFDKALEQNNIEYVGTRLHGGIRALQKCRRAIIIAVDNRAIEKKKDFNLPVCGVDELNEKINKDYETDIILPEENIIMWQKQFDKIADNYRDEQRVDNASV